MEFYQLEYFRKLCEFGKFSKTAEYFHVTQPAISIAIKKLEKEFGGELIAHNNKAFHITPMGLEFLSYANRIHMEIQNMYADLAQYGNHSHKVIRLGMSLSTYGRIASAISKDFIPKHPEIPIYLSHMSPEYMKEALSSGNLDICITFDALTNNLQKLPLGRMEFAAYIPPDHKFHSLPHISPEMLAGESLLVSREPLGIGKCLHEYFKQFDFESHYLEIGNLLPADALDSAMRGEGIAFLDINFSPSNCIPLDPPLYLDTAIAWSKDKVLTRDQRLLADFILSIKL